MKGFAECIAWILKLDPSEVPDPGGPDPWSLWRGWLAGRGLGLVPIENPREFSWGGPWIAILREKDSNKGEQPAVAFGPPPDIIWAPTEDPPPFTAVVSGYLIAPADVANWTPKPREITRRSGTVELIVIAAHKEERTETVEHADAIAGHGLAGDRYSDSAGTFSNHYGLGHELTLIEAEQAEAIGLAAEEARRNIVTRGIDLNALVGETFKIGDAECIGRRLCEPCAHLQRLTEPGILRKLVHKGGLRADIVKSGRISVGDRVEGFSDQPTRI